MNEPSREDIIALREDRGMTREQIAQHYNVSMSTVRRWIRELNVPRPTRQPVSPTKKKLKTWRESDHMYDGMTLMDLAREILGPRLVEKRATGFHLDGKHVSTRAVLEAAGLKFKDE